MDALKHAEEPVMIFWVDSDAIVFNPKPYFPLAVFRRDANGWHDTLWHEFHGVGQQVGKALRFVGAAASVDEDRQENADQNGDDSNDNQKLDESESADTNTRKPERFPPHDYRPVDLQYRPQQDTEHWRNGNRFIGGLRHGCLISHPT